MLAPSPDWFIGIDSVDLCDNGTWRESMNVTMLPPWDAGTDSATGFLHSNTPTSPHVDIFQITNSMPGAFNAMNPIASLGEFRFMGLHLPMVPQDNSTINSNSTVNSTSATPSNENSTATSTVSTTTDSSVGKASASFAVFVSAALILAKMLH